MITEKQFREQVKELCKVFHWKAYFTWLSMHSPDGFPDFNMVRGGRIIYAELKSERGKVTPAQMEWLTALIATGKCEVYLWRPANFEEIAEILK